MSTRDLTNRLKHYRRLRGDLTQQELADRTGVSRQSIISIENGRFRPSVELALRLARALDAQVEDLFALTDDAADAAKEDGS